MMSDAYMPRPEPMSGAQITALSQMCSDGGYDFQLALRTAQRDGEPMLRTVKESFEYQRELAMLALERMSR